MILKIQNLDSFVEDFHKKYLAYKQQKQKWWAEKYFKNYEKSNEIATKIEHMSSKIEDKGVWGMEYQIDVQTLKEYLEIYELLNEIPKVKIEILRPNSFYISKESDTFCQIED